jgi:putative redox protein
LKGGAGTMKEILTARVEWTDKLHFWGKGDFGHPVPVDYSPPLGDGQGYGGLDLLLFFKMKQDVTKFTVTAIGKRTTEHPTVLTEIQVVFDIEGNGLSSELIGKAVRLSDEKYCPVWAMLRPSTKISYVVNIR